MDGKYNIQRTEFDLETFLGILKAMDGYHVLPWRFTADTPDAFPKTIRPWELPEMPDVPVDVWRYHVGFAIDRGFVECWKPDRYEPVPPEYYDTINFQMDQQIVEDELHMRPPYRGTDATVSSNLAPARLTYAGKEFIDNLKNPTVKDRAVEAVARYGVPVMMNLVSEATKFLSVTDTPDSDVTVAPST